MVKIPYIKIPSVRVGSIDPTSDIGTGGATSAPPTPITYLTQWRMIGNSQVHTDPYLTQWKVSGNSVVNNNAILSCGDYSDVDGKYHVKISNGVTIYDIPLTEPLRKVNDVADTIEFADGVATVTRNIGRTTLNSFSWDFYSSNTRWGCYTTDIKPATSTDSVVNILCTIYNTVSSNQTLQSVTGIAMLTVERMFLYDPNYVLATDKTAFEAHIANVELIYEKITPTTETIQVSPFPISPTDTYTSANDTPYSAFEYKKNVEIWSCGEYNATDGKYHILVQPLGGSIVDIALDEPLRKVNDVADSIEYANGAGTLTRNIASAKWNDLTVRYEISVTTQYGRFYTASLKDVLLISTSLNERVTSCLSSDFIQNSDPITRIEAVDKCMCTFKVNDTTAYIYLRDTSTTSVEDFYEKYGTHEFYYRLATPTTETIQVPQIEEADSYSCVISQGGKAVSWSSFETNSE